MLNESSAGLRAAKPSESGVRMGLSSLVRVDIAGLSDPASEQMRATSGESMNPSRTYRTRVARR